MNNRWKMEESLHNTVEKQINFFPYPCASRLACFQVFTVHTAHHLLLFRTLQRSFLDSKRLLQMITLSVCPSQPYVRPYIMEQNAYFSSDAEYICNRPLPSLLTSHPHLVLHIRNMILHHSRHLKFSLLVLQLFAFLKRLLQCCG